MKPLVPKDRKMQPHAGNSQISSLDFGSFFRKVLCYLIGDLAKLAIKWIRNSRNEFLCSSISACLNNTTYSYSIRNSGDTKLRGFIKGKKSGPCSKIALLKFQTHRNVGRLLCRWCGSH